jgi:hypothetical protein
MTVVLVTQNILPRNVITETSRPLPAHASKHATKHKLSIVYRCSTTKIVIIWNGLL